MGTQARIVLYAPDAEIARQALVEAFELLALLEASMSDYRPDSELNRLSDRAGHGTIKVSPMLHGVLAQALDLAERTDGRFDPTLGRLTQLWRRTRDTRRWPDPETLRAARSDLAFRALVLTGPPDDPTTAEILDPQIRLDLGGIGKGYAAQQIVALLKSKGLPRCLVAIGGDIVAGEGPPPDPLAPIDPAQPPPPTAWRIAIETGLPAREVDPADEELGEQAVSTFIQLVDAAVSTSGDLEQFAEIAGPACKGELLRFAHILDPQTGLGLRRRVAATVIVPESQGGGGTADALATALCVAGPEHAQALLARFEGVEARVEARAHDTPHPDEHADREPTLEYVSEGFADWLQAPH
jgi:FAD:protein FMN transferase